VATDLRILPGIDRKEQSEYSVRELEELVLELKEACDGFRDDLDNIRSALGIYKIDFARWRENKFEGIVNLHDEDKGLVKVIDDLKAYLEKL